MASFLQNATIIDGEGQTVDQSTLNGKIFGLYFSAHWCPPCRGFTPVLAEKYKEIVSSGNPFEIVFVSSDQTEAAGAEYFAEMPWKMLKYNDSDTKSALSKEFGVSGIPCLVLIDEEGNLLTKDGRSAIMGPFEKLKSFETDKLEAARVEAEAIAALPDTLTHECHEHPLVKTDGRMFGCDVCNGGGRGWSYYCDQCDFDAHPKCVCDM